MSNSRTSYMKKQPEAYNVRVYGLLMSRDGESVLVSEEKRGNWEMVKFPGGGHEFGEGIGETLVREWDEEVGISVRAKSLFYINDFAQISAFSPSDQLLSVYYLIEQVCNSEIPESRIPLDFNQQTDYLKFHWISLSDLDSAEFTFPVDQHVVRLLKENGKVEVTSPSIH